MTPALFNGPIDTGLRVLAILVAVEPRQLDADSLVLLDYFLVHSDDFAGGPPSLHPASPLRVGEIAVRRRLIRDALRLFESRGLTKAHLTERGVVYGLGEHGWDFSRAMRSTYAQEVSDRANWVASEVATVSDAGLIDQYSATIERWRTEFAHAAGPRINHGSS